MFLLLKRETECAEHVLARHIYYRRVNATAPIHETINGVIDLSLILGVNAYNAKRIIADSSSDHNSSSGPHTASGNTYSLLQDRRLESQHEEHDENECNDTSHTHARDLAEISTLSINLPLFTSSAQKERLESILQSLLWDAQLPRPSSMHDDISSTKAASSGIEILRTKGVFSVVAAGTSSDSGLAGLNKDTITEYVLQGVRELYEIKMIASSSMDGRYKDDATGEGRLVLIGKGLTEDVRHAVLRSLLET